MVKILDIIWTICGKFNNPRSGGINKKRMMRKRTINVKIYSITINLPHLMIFIRWWSYIMLTCDTVSFFPNHVEICIISLRVNPNLYYLSTTFTNINSFRFGV